MCLFRKGLKGASVRGVSAWSSYCVSAYADDVTVFIYGQADVLTPSGALAVYEGASSARINWAKK